MKIDVSGVLVEICTMRKDIKRFLIDELGGLKSDRNTQADIKIKFRKKIWTHPESEMIGNEGEKTLKGLLLKTIQGAKIEIPYQNVGQRITITCEERINLSRLLHDILKPLIHYRLLGMEKALVHCSAFVYKDNCILLFGYGGSGRTTALLAFIRNGASFVADDYIIISSDGKCISLSSKLTLENIVAFGKNHFETFPEVIQRINQNPMQRFLILIKLSLNKILTWFSKNAFIIENKIGRALINIVSKRISIQKRIAIDQIYTEIQIIPKTLCNSMVSLIRHSGKKLEIIPGDAEQIVEEMIITNMMEHIRFLRNYEMFKFAFPGIKNRIIEEQAVLERKIFNKFLQDKKILRVKVPHNFSPDNLVDKMIRSL